MVYTKQQWRDGADGTTPLNAARLSVIEQGISDAHDLAAPSVITRLARRAIASVLSVVGWTYDDTTDTFTPPNAAANVVDTSTVQTVGGKKTFTDGIAVPDASLTISDVSGLPDILAGGFPFVGAFMSGTVSAVNGELKRALYRSATLVAVTATVNTPPTGATGLIIDVNRGTSPNNVASIFTPSTRPTIAPGAYEVVALANTAAVSSFAAGDVLSVDVDFPGSTPAAGLTVDVWIRF